MQGYLYDDLLLDSDSDRTISSRKSQAEKNCPMKITMFGADFKEVARQFGNVTLESTCPICNRTNKMVLDEKTYDNGLALIKQGVMVQDAFPELSSDKREFFLTGNCPCIWG